MKKLFMLFPKIKWGKTVIFGGVLSIVATIASVGTPEKVYHFVLYFFSISIFIIGIIKHKHYEIEYDSS